VLTSDRELGEWLGDTAGLGLITVVSLMFAFRAARAFRDNHLLQARELTLLQEITEKRDAAVAATLAKSRFLASVSHDLRQPMHAINLYLTALAGGYARQRQNPADAAAGETVRSSIQSLQESTNYLNSMFEALLDVSRLDAGTVAVNIQHTSLMRMVAQLEADYTQLAKAEGLRFEVRLPRQFPVMEVQTDAALLERLLRNLLVNAMRYTRTGGVRLSLVASDRQLDFRVVDTGPGVERAMRQRIFDEFYQVPGSQEKASRSANTGSGIGLGLSIASRLAEKLNARIRLHTRPGWGSVFAVRLPMRHALRPAADDWPSSILPGPTEALPGGSFVAVIDDDLEILRSTRMMLESFGLKVYTAVSGAEAVAHLGKMGERPDLLISDYRLGAEDGISVIDRLREEFNEQVPAILITGDTSAEHVAIFKQSGLTVLHKPISGHALMAAIQAEMKAQPQTPKSIPSP
jgi:signal transduction histidine kinase/CheY-like chemotaxis protein